MKISKSLSWQIDGVEFCQRAPDVGLLHVGAKVEILVVPQHHCPCRKAGQRFRVSFDVDEQIRPGRIRQVTVDPQGSAAR
jgi:hypothetical protein